MFRSKALWFLLTAHGIAPSAFTGDNP